MADKELKRGDTVYNKTDRRRGVVCEVESDRGTVLVRFNGVEKLYRFSPDDLETREKFSAPKNRKVE